MLYTNIVDTVRTIADIEIVEGTVKKEMSSMSTKGADIKNAARIELRGDEQKTDKPS